MFSLLRASSVLTAVTLTLSLPSAADAQWFGWGWNWGWEPAYYEPATPWVSYYPGRFYGSTSYYAPGGGYGDPCCGCAPCGCNPCCDPCGCSPCGSACGPGGCPGGACGYEAPAGNAPIPDRNSDTPPPRPDTSTPARDRDMDDAPPFERPTTPEEPRGRGFDSIDTDTPFPERTRGSQGGASSGTGSSGNPVRDNSTAPAGGTARPRAPFGTDGSDPLRDPANDGSFDVKKPNLDGASETVIPQRSPAATPAIDETGPNLDAKSTSAPVAPRSRLARLDRTNSGRATEAWSAVEARVVRK